MAIKTACDDKDLREDSLAALNHVIQIHSSLGDGIFERAMNSFKRLRPVFEEAIRASPGSVTKPIQKVLLTYGLVDKQLFQGL